MGNGVLYTFMATEALFVIGGILLLVLGVTTKAASNSKQNVDTIANTLLLPQRLLTGTCRLQISSLPRANHAATSRNRQRRLGLNNLPPLHPLPPHPPIEASSKYTATLSSSAPSLPSFSASRSGMRPSRPVPTLPPSLPTRLVRHKHYCSRNSTVVDTRMQHRPRMYRTISARMCLLLRTSSHANSLLSRVFTTQFAIVGIDMILLLAIACLLKDRKEKERYALIDAKTGSSPI